jgi:hypothetical protein
MIKVEVEKLKFEQDVYGIFFMFAGEKNYIQRYINLYQSDKVKVQKSFKKKFESFDNIIDNHFNTNSQSNPYNTRC